MSSVEMIAEEKLAFPAQEESELKEWNYRVLFRLNFTNQNSGITYVVWIIPSIEVTFLEDFKDVWQAWLKRVNQKDKSTQS